MLVENKSARIIVVNGVRIIPLEKKELDLKGLQGKQKAVVDSWFDSGDLVKVRQPRRKKDKQPEAPLADQPEAQDSPVEDQPDE